jgi:putative methionine-R-sulfoxide reductase with GAF domain
MNGIQTHLYDSDEKAKEKLSELEEPLQAIRWIDSCITGFEDYAEKVVEVLHTRVSGFTWVGYYWVRPTGLTLVASRGVKTGEKAVIGMRRGVIGRAAASGRTVVGSGSSPLLSEIATPVESHGVVVGIIAVKSQSPNAFGPEMVEFLDRVAAEMSNRWHGSTCD